MILNNEKQEGWEGIEITEDLLKKRSEHNDGVLSTLNEITLHQFNIGKIGKILGEKCRNLKILYLQDNLISKIENMYHLKKLKYLNLALNNIRKIEGLESCEELEKLDLSVNFIDDAESLEILKFNHCLSELFLIGNPCEEYDGFRMFALSKIPSLKSLDGSQISKYERIKSLQEAEKWNYFYKKTQKKWLEESEELFKKSKEPKFNEKGERLFGNDPVSRTLAAREIYRGEESKESNSKTSSKQKKMTIEEEIKTFGKVMQKNEGKWEYKIKNKKKSYILEVHVGKFCLTEDINVDVQVNYVNIEVKGKRLTLRFDEDVNPDDSVAERSKATGVLKLEIPKTTIFV